MVKILASLESIEEFHIAGWLPYIEKLHRYDQSITKDFSHKCNDKEAMIKGLQLSISKETIAEVTRLPCSGEW